MHRSSRVRAGRSPSRPSLPRRLRGRPPGHRVKRAQPRAPRATERPFPRQALQLPDLQKRSPGAKTRPRRNPPSPIGIVSPATWACSSKRPARLLPLCSSRARPARRHRPLGGDVSGLFKTLGPGRGSLDERPRPDGAGAGTPGRANSSISGPRACAVCRAAAPPSSEASQAVRQALRGTGMAARIRSSTSCGRAYLMTTRLGLHDGRRGRYARSADPRQGAVLPSPGVERALAVQFPGHEPRIAEGNLRAERGKPCPRHAHAGGGHRGRPRRAQDPPERCEPLRARCQHGGDTRQGGVPQRADGADPICADDAPRCSGVLC